MILSDSGPYRWFNTEIVSKRGSSTSKMSEEAKFHLRLKTSSFCHLQGAIAAGKRNESSLLPKAAPLWHLPTSKFHLFHVGGQGCGRLSLLQEGPVQGDRGHAMAPVHWDQHWQGCKEGGGEGLAPSPLLGTPQLSWGCAGVAGEVSGL